MPQEKVELARAWLDLWVRWFSSAQDPDRLAVLASEHLSQNVVYEEDPVWPDAGTYEGLDAVVRRFAEYIDLVHVERVQVGEVIEAGNLVIAEIQTSMLGTGAGEAIEFVWTYTMRMEDGRIVHFRAWYDRGEALEAAGLSN